MRVSVVQWMLARSLRPHDVPPAPDADSVSVTDEGDVRHVSVCEMCMGPRGPYRLQYNTTVFRRQFDLMVTKILQTEPMRVDVCIEGDAADLEIVCIYNNELECSFIIPAFREPQTFIEVDNYQLRNGKFYAIRNGVVDEVAVW